MQTQSTPATKIIVNPMANKGSCGRRWPEIRRRLDASFGALSDDNIAITRSQGHATALARAAVQAGYRRLIAIGGDGTFNEMLNGLIEDDRLMAPDLVLGQVPGGTSNELARTCGHLELAAACRAAASQNTREIDVFKAEATDLDGTTVKRYGFLLAIVGAPATISWRTQRVPLLKRLGPLAYVIMTGLTTLTYRPATTTVAFDDEPAGTREIWGVMLCSFSGAGVGLQLAPGADPSDGKLDVVELGDFGRLEALLAVLPKLGDGSYTQHAKVTRRHVTSVRLDSRQLVRADVDGESIGRLPMSVRLLPARIKIAVL